MEMDVDTLNLVIIGLEQAVSDLDNGLFLNQSKKCVVGGVHKKKYNVKNVGEVAALSFPTLCVFTGLCRSKESIMTAMFARVNDSPDKGGSPNSYFNSMNNYIQQFVDPELGKYDRTYMILPPTPYPNRGMRFSAQSKMLFVHNFVPPTNGKFISRDPICTLYSPHHQPYMSNVSVRLLGWRCLLTK